MFTVKQLQEINQNVKLVISSLNTTFIAFFYQDSLMALITSGKYVHFGLFPKVFMHEYFLRLATS